MNYAKPCASVELLNFYLALAKSQAGFAFKVTTYVILKQQYLIMKAESEANYEVRCNTSKRKSVQCWIELTALKANNKNYDNNPIY